MGIFKKSKLTEQEIADKVAAEIKGICDKYNCELGVWLNWRDLLVNLELLKENVQLNELQFGLQMRIRNEATGDNNVSGGKK